MARTLTAERRGDRYSRDVIEFRPAVSPRDSTLALRLSRNGRRIAIAIVGSAILHAIVIAAGPQWQAESWIEPAAFVNVYLPEITATAASEESVPVSRPVTAKVAAKPPPSADLSTRIEPTAPATEPVPESTLAKSEAALPSHPQAAGAPAVASYAQMLAALIAKQRSYPRVAELRRMQGRVEVQMRVGADGRLTEARLSRSSGFEVLDRQALEMVRRAQPLPEPPDTLRGKEFLVNVPVMFQLEH